MATPTYDLLDSTTLSSSASSVTFSGISGSYRDIIIQGSVIGTAAAQMFMRANSDSGSNYSNVEMLGNGSSTQSGAGSSVTYGYLDYNSSSLTTTPSSAILQIMDYSATDKHKTMLYRGGRTDGRVHASVVRWASTSAITSVTLYATNFAAGTVLSVYGVAS